LPDRLTSLFIPFPIILVDWRNWITSLMPGGKNYVSSAQSRDRLYHKAGCDCQYLQNIHPGNILYFRDPKAARRLGLSMCRTCMQEIEQRTLQDFT
jgi:hypothetical protein